MTKLNLKNKSNHIHVDWEGPFTYEQACRKNDIKVDRGVYQIYGTHPLYGSDVLIYIGKAAKQTFGKRLGQEEWGDFNQDSSRVTVYLGKLSGYDGTPGKEDKEHTEWMNQITKVERLLIYAHWPAGNSSGLNVNFDKDWQNIHILNWGQYRDLLPEISGARYSDLYSSYKNYINFGEDL